MSRHIEWNEAEKCFVGTVDELPDVTVFAKTRMRTMNGLNIAIETLRECAADLRLPFPDVPIGED